RHRAAGSMKTTESFLNSQQDDHFWSGKRVCVTGGAGFLGYHIVKQLTALNARVRVLSLPPVANHPLFQESDIETVWGDVRDRRVVYRALDDCEVIFHTAAVVAMWGPALRQMQEVHVLGTQNVLAAARPEARIVHTSSIVGIGASRAGKMLNEESPFNLDRVRIDYVHAKRAAELLARKAAAGQHVVVTNPGCLLGPEDYPQSVMGRF